jgi:hypothetical protein
VVYCRKNLGVYDSCEKFNEQVDGYKNNCYKGYMTKKEAKNRDANFVKINNEVWKTVWTSGRVNNLIILIQFIVIMVVLLS